MARIAYFDCSAGAAGDMLLAATLDVLREVSWDATDCQPWREKISGLLSLETDARVEIRDGIRGGLQGLKVDFFVGNTHADDFHHHESEKGHHAHSHGHGRHLKDILGLLEAQVEQGVFGADSFELAKEIFNILAKAEAKVHGTTIDKVHFHEVGAFDSIMDIAGFAVAWKALNVDRVVASAVTTGEGTVDTAHGCLGVPPPAVVEILKTYGIPTSGKAIGHEALTPTGAACLAAVVSEWGGMPAYKKLVAQGVGLGNREVEQMPNAVRLMLGE